MLSQSLKALKSRSDGMKRGYKKALEYRQEQIERRKQQIVTHL